MPLVASLILEGNDAAADPHINLRVFLRLLCICMDRSAHSCSLWPVQTGKLAAILYPI